MLLIQSALNRPIIPARIWDMYKVIEFLDRILNYMMRL